jgi:hypothetical protein
MIDAAVAEPCLFDLCEEVGEKNHVRVVHFRARKRGERVFRQKVMDEMADPAVALGPALVMQDSLRVLAGKKPIYLPEAFRRLGGELRAITPNIRTNVGIDYVSAQLGGAALAAANVADWIALSANATAVAAGDSSSTAPWSTAQTTDGATGEFTTYGGMARKVAVYAHTASVANYTMTATWTATAAVTAVQKAGLFGGTAKNAQGNNVNNVLFLANVFTPTTLANNDQLSLTWTVNI